MTPDQIAQLTDVAAKVGRLEAQFEQFTLSQAKNADNTALLVEIVTAAKGGFKVLGWLGAAIKWVSVVAGAAAGVWAAWSRVTGK